MDIEIKFRGLAINTQNAWIEGNLVVDGKRAFIFENFLNSIGDIVGVDGFFEVKPETVGQFTNICETCEGDTAVFEAHHPGICIPKNGYEGEVKMQDGSWVVDNGHISYPLYQENGIWHTTGNIHQQEA